MSPFCLIYVQFVDTDFHYYYSSILFFPETSKVDNSVTFLTTSSYLHLRPWTSSNLHFMFRTHGKEALLLNQTQSADNYNSLLITLNTGQSTYNTEHRSDIMFTFNLLQPNISMIVIPSQAFLSINIYVLVTLIYSNIR